MPNPVIRLNAALRRRAGGRRLGRAGTVSLFAIGFGYLAVACSEFARFIHWDAMTKETYWGVFLRPIISDSERQEIWQALDPVPPRRPGPRTNRKDECVSSAA